MRMKSLFKSIRQYPSAIAGFVIIAILIVVSITAVVSIPYSEVKQIWRGGAYWEENPKTVPPAWVNLFRSSKLPETLVIRSEDAAESTSEALSATMTRKVETLTFDYNYRAFPTEVSVFFDATYESRRPQVKLTWLAADGREIELFNEQIGMGTQFRISQDSTLQRRKFNNLNPSIGLFIDPATSDGAASRRRALQGTYTLRVQATVFEPDSFVDTKLVVYGGVHGVAGTDALRRNLLIGLLWGTPLALCFGLLAAVGSTMMTFCIAAIGAWFGGWVDAIIQRITEVRLALPILPILIMLGTFYSRSIWIMLGVIIILNIFGAAIKTYRAMFLQVKNSPYVEAARAYGASSMRIVFRYLIPRIIPVLIPNFVTLIPTFVFLEAALAVLGLGDPVLPTWGKILNEANGFGALYKGMYYWVLEPAVLLIVTGLAFSMVGFALDRIFNPRLRGI